MEITKFILVDDSNYDCFAPYGIVEVALTRDDNGKLYWKYDSHNTRSLLRYDWSKNNDIFNMVPPHQILTKLTRDSQNRGFGDYTIPYQEGDF